MSTQAKTCPRCAKIHKTLRPALSCLHEWQFSIESPSKDNKERKFSMDEYMVLQGIVQSLGG